MLLIAIIFTLWSSFSQHDSVKVSWSINQAMEASEDGKIVFGLIQQDPSKGEHWYRLYGKAKSEAPIRLLNGKIVDFVDFEAQGRLTSARFNRLIDSSSNWHEKPSSTLLTDLLLSVLPFLIVLFIFYLLFARQMRTAGKSAMSFGKSKAKLLVKSENKKTFADVAGCDEAKEEMAGIVDFLKNPKKFQDIGGRIPKGCLMVGPPGTGKTLLAQAIAGEADVPFFSISGSDFVEMFVGVGAARVRDMFEQGRKNAPCIVFIDEIDAVGRHRGAGLGGGNDEREQTLNSILVEMDGFDGRDGVIIIAATNRPDVLDAALLRPGRFDRQIVIDLPDLNGRLEILKVHAAKVKLAKNVSLAEIARGTSGFSGADLENLLNESALLAARFDKKEIERIDVDEARDKISFGRERKKLMDKKDKIITAYHEAGHAVVQVLVDDGNLPVHKVTIIPRGQSLGSTMFIPKKDILNYSRSSSLSRICCLMGGRVAEELEFSEITSGAAADIKSATKVARHMVCDWGMSPLGPVAYGENQDHIFLGREITRTQNYSEKTAQQIDSEIFKIIDEEYLRAKKILTEKRDCLKKLAEALLRYETVDGRLVYELIKHGEFRSRIVSNRRSTKKKTELPKGDNSKSSDGKSGNDCGAKDAESRS
ncbi:MAG: ATP-dependent zinc metalloprotease FtsH [Puniceicoccales bacterium]|nr:ATP-dependent zinc metalloprotease FtsH [Puniceicoccales bacterium]